MYVDGDPEIATSLTKLTSCTFSQNRAPSGSGGGIASDTARLSVTGCMFLSNESQSNGGAVYSSGSVSSPLSFNDCTFSGNSSGDGGGVWLSGGSDAVFDECSFANNTFLSVGGEGGGLYVNDCDVTISNTMFDGNSNVNTAGPGGGAYLFQSVASLQICQFQGNAGTYGAGLNVTGPDSVVDLTSCDFDTNIATQRGGAIYNSSASVNITGGAFTGNRADAPAAGAGGAIAVFGLGSLVVSGATFTANYAAEGGGIRIKKDSTLEMYDSTLIGNGVYNGTITDEGGGLYLGGKQFFDVDYVISGCTIQGNQASLIGGGVYLKGPNASFSDTTITGNDCGGNGGGVYAFNGSFPSFRGCKITNNTAGQNGGGVYLDNPPGDPAYPTFFWDTLIAGNSANGASPQGLGGGIYQGYGLLELVNCTIANNSAVDNGGGVWWDNDGLANDAFANVPLTITNSIFWGNTAAQTLGSQLRIEGPCTIDYSDFDGGPVDIDFDPTIGDLVWELTSIQSRDPLFVDAFNGDYRLKNVDPDFSPCVNAGSNSLAKGLADADRHPRIKGCIVDMGAYEYAVTPLEAPTAEPGGVDKNRFISFIPGNPDMADSMAIRVRLTEMMDPIPPPPDPVNHPAPDFSAFNGQVRWVGQPTQGVMQANPLELFAAAHLACDPAYPVAPWAWDPTDVLHVTGNEIVPSSTYQVQVFEDEECPDVLEGMFSAPLTITTARWGDVRTPFQDPEPSSPPQPNAQDLTSGVDSVKEVPGALGLVRAKLQPGDMKVDDQLKVTVLDLQNLVDAVKSFQYPYKTGPAAPKHCPCSANIRTDSNNDGVIDGNDEDVENISPGVIIYVNDDDDNFNDILDLDEQPVTGEDDLAEIQLPVDCYPADPSTAWWAISWLNPTIPSIQVWTASDKSTPVGGPIGNGTTGVTNPWPPPASVWIESVATFEDLDITFTVSDDGSTIQRHALLVPQQGSTVRATAQRAWQVELRVSMLVEPNADTDHPDRPQAVTGGCKLRKSTITSVIEDNLKDAKKILPGLRFRWDGMVHVLESGCMKILNPALAPVGGNVGCIFSSQYQTVNNNPRTVDADWFMKEIVGMPAGGGGQMSSPGDVGFELHSCKIMIYFTGNIEDWTFLDREVHGLTHGGVNSAGDNVSYILVNDGAGESVTTNPNPPAWMVRDKTLLHEEACHWLTDSVNFTGYTDGHLDVPDPFISGQHKCPDNLCQGESYDRLQSHCWPDKSVPTTVPANPIGNQISALLNQYNCNVPYK